MPIKYGNKKNVPTNEESIFLYGEDEDKDTITLLDTEARPAKTTNAEIYKIVKNTLFLRDEKGNEYRLSFLDYAGKKVGDTVSL